MRCVPSSSTFTVAGAAWVVAQLSVCLLATPASPLELDIEARYWAPSIGGGLSILDSGLSFGLDFDRDFGLDADGSLEGRLTLRPGLGIFVRATYQNISSTGDRSLGLDIGGIELPLLGRVRSELDFDYGRFAIGWQYTSSSKKLRIGPFVEAKGMDGIVGIEVTGPLVEGSAQEDFSAAVGSVGGLLQVRASDRLEVFAELSALVGENDADLTDAEVGVRFFALEKLAIGAGYRLLTLDGDFDQARLKLDFDGFFVSVGGRF